MSPMSMYFKLTSHGVLHYLQSADLSKSFLKLKNVLSSNHILLTLDSEHMYVCFCVRIYVRIYACKRVSERVCVLLKKVSLDVCWQHD